MNSAGSISSNLLHGCAALELDGGGAWAFEPLLFAFLVARGTAWGSWGDKGLIGLTAFGRAMSCFGVDGKRITSLALLFLLVSSVGFFTLRARGRATGAFALFLLARVAVFLLVAAGLGQFSTAVSLGDGEISFSSGVVGFGFLGGNGRVLLGGSI